MKEEIYFDKCIKRVRELKKMVKDKYAVIRWTNKIVLGCIDVNQSYVNPSKGKLLKDETFKKIYGKLMKLKPEQIRKKVIKSSK